jgi:hypothetical protein
MFTDPELARIGLNETEAKTQGIAYRLAKIPMVAVLRTRTPSETRGFMKTLIDKKVVILQVRPPTYELGLRESGGSRSTWVETSWVVRTFGIARTSYELKSGDALIDVGEWWKREVRFGLIPVGDGVEVVRPVVGVTVLDAGLHGFCERYRRVEMKAVHA